jgi:hypothetical protein
VKVINTSLCEGKVVINTSLCEGKVVINTSLCECKVVIHMPIQIDFACDVPQAGRGRLN